VHDFPVRTQQWGGPIVYREFALMLSYYTPEAAVKNLAEVEIELSAKHSQLSAGPRIRAVLLYAIKPYLRHLCRLWAEEDICTTPLTCFDDDPHNRCKSDLDKERRDAFQ